MSRPDVVFLQLGGRSDGKGARRLGFVLGVGVVVVLVVIVDICASALGVLADETARRIEVFIVVEERATLAAPRGAVEEVVRHCGWLRCEDVVGWFDSDGMKLGTNWYSCCVLICGSVVVCISYDRAWVNS